MQLQGSLLKLLLLVSGIHAADAAFRGIARLEHVLHLILTRSCAAHNLSVYVSTGYREQLPLAERRLVDRVLGHVLQRRSRDAQVPMLLDKQLQPQLNLQVHLMLFFVQNTQQFIWSASGNAGATSTFKHKFLVVLLRQGDSGTSSMEMSHLFSYMLHQRLNIDVLLLLMHLEVGSVQSYSFWPFTAAACLSTDPVFLPLQEARLEQLYPQKVNNLHGCPLHVIVWQVPPYMELHLEHRELDQQLQGWDAKLLKLMAQRLNFRLQLVANEPPHLIGGESHMNGSFTGAFRMLRQRRANLTCGCAACLPARAKYLSHTVSYNQVEYVIVLRSAGAYSNYEIMLFPFARSTWLLLLVFAVLCLLQRLMGINCTHWLPLPVQLGGLMLLHVLRLGYESSIFEFVHNAPVRPLPQSVDQALQSDYSFIVDHATHRMAAWLPRVHQRVHVYPGRAVDMLGLLLQQPASSNWGVLSSRDFLAYYLAGHREQRHRFVVLEPKVMNNMLCMHLPLGSYMAPIISQMLFDLRSFGVCQKLSQYAIPTTPTSRDQPQDAFGESMRFLHAACYCLIYAESLILCVFLLELLSLHSHFRWLRWCLERL